MGRYQVSPSVERLRLPYFLIRDYTNYSDTNKRIFQWEYKYLIVLLVGLIADHNRFLDIIIMRMSEVCG